MPITSQEGLGHPDLAVLKPNPLLFKQFHFSCGKVQQRWAQILLKKRLFTCYSQPPLSGRGPCVPVIQLHLAYTLCQQCFSAFQLFSSLSGLKSTHSCPPLVAGTKETLQLLQRSPVRRDNVLALFIHLTAHLSWLDGSSQVFSQDSSVIGQILVHHLIMWEEEQIGFGAFNGFFVIPICKEKWGC